jgi:hypothetical protein
MRQRDSDRLEAAVGSDDHDVFDSATSKRDRVVEEFTDLAGRGEGRHFVVVGVGQLDAGVDAEPVVFVSARGADLLSAAPDGFEAAEVGEDDAFRFWVVSGH